MGFRMPVYKSGAFLQQCFSVHPLSLDLKLVAPPEVIGVMCSNCRMRHRLTLYQEEAVVKSAATTEKGNNEMLLLERCFSSHPEDLRISLVHVERQAVEFRCHPCRRSYTLNVALFETHQS